MSKTSIRERNKAIRLAWEREQKLVSEGRGTRNWSKEQQQDILDPDKGKAYDENGRAFEGQHMKSAAEYPEYQGDPDNIQFLTREEHLEAHKGNWHNPTNWFYNPETKEFIDFGENKYVPCEIINLTDPVISVCENVQVLQKSMETFENGDKEKNSDNEQRKGDISSRKINTFEVPTMQETSKKSKTCKKRTNISETFKGFGKEYSKLEKIVDKIIVIGGIALAAVVAYVVEDKVSRDKKTDADAGASSGNFHNDDDDFLEDDDYDDSMEDDDSIDDDYDDISSDGDYPDERSSPVEHMVSSHGQHYNTKNGPIWREKEAYWRGGKHDD